MNGRCRWKLHEKIVEDVAAEINGKEVSMFPVKLSGAGFAVLSINNLSIVIFKS